MKKTNKKAPEKYRCPNCRAIDRYNIIDVSHMDRDYSQGITKAGYKKVIVLNTYKLTTKYFKECKCCYYRTLHREEFKFLTSQQKKKYVEYDHSKGGVS